MRDYTWRCRQKGQVTRQGACMKLIPNIGRKVFVPFRLPGCSFARQTTVYTWCYFGFRQELSIACDGTGLPDAEGARYGAKDIEFWSPGTRLPRVPGLLISAEYHPGTAPEAQVVLYSCTTVHVGSFCQCLVILPVRVSLYSVSDFRYAAGAGGDAGTGR